MPSPPKKLKSFRGLKKWLNELADWLVWSQIINGGLGTTITQTTLGRAVNASPGKAGGAAVAHFPWEITVDGNATDGYFAHVRPGSVNSLVPSNIFSTFSISANNTYWVKVKADTDGKTPNALTIEVDTSPVDSATAVQENVAPASFWDTLGMIMTGTAAGDGSFVSTIFQIRSNNLSAIPAVSFVEDRVAPSIYEEPFIRWWGWSITEA